MLNHPRNPRATLWLLAYNGLTAETHLSILHEMAQWPNLVHRVKAGDANIDRARSKVASWFLQDTSTVEPQTGVTVEATGDVMLMVDADNAWCPGDLAKIAKRALEHNAVVGGIYPKRAFNQGPALRAEDDTIGDFAIGEDALFPCEFVGTGFIAIPKSILRAVGETLPHCRGDVDKDPFPTYQPFFMPYVLHGRLGDEYPTDDHAFCARVRECGFQVLASTYPRLTHEGMYSYRMVDSNISPPLDRDIEIHLKGAERVAV